MAPCALLIQGYPGQHLADQFPNDTNDTTYGNEDRQLTDAHKHQMHSTARTSRHARLRQDNLMSAIFEFDVSILPALAQLPQKKKNTKTKPPSNAPHKKPAKLP